MSDEFFYEDSSRTPKGIVESMLKDYGPQEIAEDTGLSLEFVLQVQELVKYEEEKEERRKKRNNENETNE